MDANSPFDHYQNNWILPEESIVFSQPSLFLLDMNQEKKHEIKKAEKLAEEEVVEKTEQAVRLKKELGLQVKKSAKPVEKERLWY